MAHRYKFEDNVTPHVNLAPTTGAAAMFNVKRALKAGGRTVPKSSDGATYKFDGDQITHASTGAGGMQVNSAWFVIRAPDGREWCVQRGTTNLVYRQKYSRAGGFGDGKITAVAATSIVDAETFTITVGGTPYVFEFNKSGGVGGGSIAVAVTDGQDAATVCGLMVAAINGAAIGVTAYQRAGQAYLVLKLPSPGQITLAETVVNAGFVTVIPSATVVPAAIDEAVLLGGGTDSAPTFASVYSTDNTYRQQIVVDDAAPYTWGQVCYPNGGGNVNSSIICDHMRSGSHSASDIDPVVWTTSTSLLMANISIADPAGVQGWLKAGDAAEGFVGISAMAPGTTGGGQAGGFGTSPEDNLDEGVEVMYGRLSSQTAPVGWKGFGTFPRWKLVDRDAPDYFDDLTTGRRWLYAGDFLFPFDPATAPAT